MDVIVVLQDYHEDGYESVSLKQIVKELFEEEVDEKDFKTWWSVIEALELGEVWGMVKKKITLKEIQYYLDNKFAEFLSEFGSAIICIM